MPGEVYVFAGQSNAKPNPDDTQVGMHGPFSERMAQLRPGVPIVLISTASGGSKLSAWRKDWRTTTHYGAAMAQIRSAVAAGHTIKGLIWWQGESDTGVDPVTLQALPGVLTWTADFTRLIADFRADIGIPNLPVVFMQLGPEPSGNYAYAAWGGFQVNQSLISAPKVAMVVTSDQAALGPNNPHITTAGYAVVGRRVAEAMHALQ